MSYVLCLLNYTYVVSGAIDFSVGDEREIAHAGDAIQIPGGTPHGPIEILEDSVSVDTFSSKCKEFEE